MVFFLLALSAVLLVLIKLFIAYMPRGRVIQTEAHGGDIVGEILKAHGVKFVFTLVGGHISPILVSARKLGIRVIDVRHEVTTVFAADAVARLTGIPGVAVVTAGPGVTNTVCYILAF
jgi:thiamine pyrophosphate-dependent acetolactate synthase large subunit-like protein